MTRTFNWRLVFKTWGVLTTIEAIVMLIPTFAAWWYHEADMGAWVVSSAITWLSSWWMLLAGRNAEKMPRELNVSYNKEVRYFAPLGKTRRYLIITDNSADRIRIS